MNIINAIFSLEAVYIVVGVVLFIFSILTIADEKHPHRLGSALFWFILGLIFAAGGVMPPLVTGLLVLVMVGIDGLGKVKPAPTPPEQRHEAVPPEPDARGAHVPSGGVLDYERRPVYREARLRYRIFIPVLTIPLVTIVVATTFRILQLDTTRGALVGLCVGGLAAMALAWGLTRCTAHAMMDSGRRLNECMGAVNILPQLLAALGVVFTAAGVGDVMAHLIKMAVPGDNLFLLIVANCLGMAVFTAVMGNTFASFPVIVAGVLVPLIVKPFGVDPAMAGIITLTAGSSGTLSTPMAANFNIVPAALLEMKDTSGVIKFQIPFAWSIWPMHVITMYVLAKMMMH